MTLVREPWTVPDEYPFGDDVLVPLRAGEADALADRMPEVRVRNLEDRVLS